MMTTTILTMTNTKKILITGGAGFLGTHLTKRLLNEGHNVLVYDNLITGNIKNTEQFKNNPNFKFVEKDICVIPSVVQVDEIYNLASIASPPHYQEYPIQTLRTSYEGTWNMLMMALQTKAKILQASTSEVYGDPLEHPQKESYWGNVNPIGVRSCYDEGKRIAETLCFEFRKQFNVDTKIVRIFNTYGSFMNPEDGRVVSNFIMQALRGIDITIYGDGSQTRSFCHADDLVDGLIKVMGTDSDVMGAFNLGNPNEFTIKQLAELVLEKTGSTSKIIYEELPKDDPKQRKPDITKVTAALGWEPKISLSEGLDRTIEYFKTCL